jgi:hypothetical protein
MTLLQRRIADLIVRVQNEFPATDSVHLTAPEVQRRVGTDDATCTAILDALVDAGVLRCSGDGYTRSHRSHPAGPPPARRQLAA